MDPWSPDVLADVRLSLVKDIGPRLHQALLAAFGSSAAALAAPREALERVDGIGPKLARQIFHAPPTADVEAELRIAHRQGIRLLSRSDPAYPASLKQIADPPQLLYVRGQLLEDDALAVGMVGTRRGTRYGHQQAERLAAGLARAGVTVVSGLARGIDAAAHHGALEAGGRTVAVIAGGLLQITPAENLKLADRVAEQGCLVSEAPPRRPPTPGSFPQRNRLISGLALGVVVVEAGDRSGALITARHAAEQGREVFAVPGQADNPSARGCHRLIQEGAKLVTCVDDILNELSHTPAPIERDDGTQLRSAAELSLNDIERQVLDAISTSATQVDDVVAATGLPVHRVLSTISVLEMRHLLRRVSGTEVMRI